MGKAQQREAGQAGRYQEMTPGRLLTTDLTPILRRWLIYLMRGLKVPELQEENL